MRTWIVFVLLFLVAACSGDAPPGSGKCTGELYDACIEEHECASGVCMNFMGDGFQVCTQPCDDTNPCPDGAECNGMNICKPAAPNECTL